MAKGAYIGIPTFEKRTLPSGYTQVEYIQSSGTQYIDTGFKPNQNTRLVAEIAFLGTVGQNVAGVRKSTSDTTNRFGIVSISSASKLGAFFGTSLIQGVSFDSSKHKYELSSAGLTVDSTSYGGANTGTFSCGFNFVLFGWSDGGTVTKTNSRVYSCQLYDNDTLVRDFVPCKNSSGTIGLYDLANSKFYTNAGTGTFSVGTDKESVARKIKKGYIGIETFEKKPLPSGYTQVEYIQSSGTQYIDTGFVPNQDTRVVCDCEYQASSSSWLFAVRVASGKGSFSFLSHNNRFRTDYGASYTQYFATSTTQVTRIDKNKNITTINGNETLTDTTTAFNSTYPLFLFAVNTAGTPSGYSSAKLKNMQIYDNGTLVRDFVPCKNSSGTVGLYDVVNGKFYINAGTGSFTAGTDKQSVARKIKKAYIGIGGVARPCWSGGKPTYYGTITKLNKRRYSAAGGAIGDYALFYGGVSDWYEEWFADVEVYDKNLVKQSNISGPEIAVRDASVGYTNDYVIFFAGDRRDAIWTLPVTAYSATLTRKVLANYTDGNSSETYRGCATIGGYALFAGGYTGSFTSGRNDVNAYNNSLTKSKPTALSSKRGGLGGATVGNHAIFVGGSHYDDNTGEGDYTLIATNVAEAYDSNLTKSTITPLSAARGYISSAMAGKYALFAGGRGTYYTNSKVVEAYDENLVRTTITSLSKAAHIWAAASLGTNALFACGGDGYTGTPSAAVEIYDENLTKTIGTSLSIARQQVTATTVGENVLFAGGHYYKNSSWFEVEDVDVYKLI